MTLVGLVAGIGFTMAIFIASLAFPDPKMLGAATLAILAASAVAGAAALLIGRLLLVDPQAGDTLLVTPEEAEASTER